ncbi:MAG: type II secretion system F family protein [Candidatus Eremiobacteraeota bacterium]|nr:type II secretion system F family protein [Candidatus Eremiobacteraeota bacterium]
MASSDNGENNGDGHWLDGLVKPAPEDEAVDEYTSPFKPLKPGQRRPGAGQSAPRKLDSELAPMEPMSPTIEGATGSSVPEAVTERRTSSLSSDATPVPNPAAQLASAKSPASSGPPKTHGPVQKNVPPQPPAESISKAPTEKSVPTKSQEAKVVRQALSKPPESVARSVPPAPKRPPSKPTLRPLHQTPNSPLKPKVESSPEPSRHHHEAPEYKVRIRVSGKSKKQRLVMYRALASMLEAGLPIFGAFEFLAEQAETEEVRVACRRIAMDLATGHTLPRAARSEPALFSPTAVRVLEVGMRSGMLVMILQRLADDEDQSWRLRNRVWGQMIYPLALAILALAAALLLPPLVLAGVLEEVVKLSTDPPAITVWILSASSALSSPATIAGILLFFCFAVYLLAQPAFRERLWRLEPILWRLPWIGEVVRNALTTRFLQLFSLTCEVGLPVLQGLSLSFGATGSQVMANISERVRDRVIAGESLSDSLECEGLLPQIAVESIRIGEQTGKFSVMMRKAADIMLAELDYRIETTLKLIEPMLLLTLGVFVGIFAAGCLLPILKLAESL